MSGATDLSGTYGGLDGSTYYVRQTGGTNIHQPGHTIWWLGLMRDRQPVQRGTNFPIIGSNQLKPAFDANDPPCTSGQCWAFATVFRGTITESPTETVIEGDWAGVPQRTSQGSSGGHMKFFVFNHKNNHSCHAEHLSSHNRKNVRRRGYRRFTTNQNSGNQ